MSAAEPTVLAENLSKRYGRLTAVDSVSFEVHPGEIFGLLGPNGAGKTTTVEMVEGLRAPDGGRLRVCGEDPGRAGRRGKQRVGIQLQSMQLPPRLRVREALRLFASFYPHTLPLAEVLARMGLVDCQDRPFEALSGGQKQRLALALAMQHQPQLILVDEPTASLDVQARRSLHDCILEWRAEGTSVLLTTHDLDEAERLCDRVAILHHGRILATGRPTELMAADGEHQVEIRLHARLETPFPAMDELELRAEGRRLSCRMQRVEEQLPQLLERLRARGGRVEDLRVSTRRLEDVLLRFTTDDTAPRGGPG